MTDPFRHPDARADTARRWVKMTVIVAIVVGLLVVVLLSMGGGHGPSRHF